MILDRELQAVGFGPGHAFPNCYHKFGPDPLPIETFPDVDMELGSRGAALDVVIARQIGGRPFQFSRPGRYDVDNGRVEFGGQATAGLKIIQRPLPLFAPWTGELFNDRLEDGPKL